MISVNLLQENFCFYGPPFFSTNLLLFFCLVRTENKYLSCGTINFGSLIPEDPDSVIKVHIVSNEHIIVLRKRNIIYCS